ncbi:hypothetical protein [Micromonospora zamorensis]|uniref:hypothetical protein n=1 Tax=Micromonospora zamorensis TaxID=709883 RepID=UPI0008200495|nr:hypothetical protein [Micromonospora zamorensis]SCG38260.1 hypothetical protein GA0070619_0625 [Micromonospora zamorensis]
MANSVNLEFAGDATKLAKAAKQAEQATAGVGKAATDANDDLRKAAGGSDEFTSKVGSLGAAVDGASTAIGDAAGTLQAFADIQAAGFNKTQRLERALNDMAQAQEDANQAMIDGKQATLDIGQAQIDAEQAVLDQAAAQKEYNAAVKEHGAGSEEARQAALDLKQAQQDLKQANLDVDQANADANQSTIDLKNAQLDLNEATKEANPPELQEWADKINMIAPILTGLVGVVALVTAAQWAWNIAQLASPTTWIILAIVALIAVIVLIATQTTWFQDLWNAAWGGIKDAASAVGSWIKDTLWDKWIKGAFNSITDKAGDLIDYMKDMPDKLKKAFSKVTDFIFAPFRAAFNKVSDAWNYTIGSLSWSVPGWIPGIGGNSISVPDLPKFHSGGIVPGTPGSEVMAVLQAGERVTPVTGSGGGAVVVIDSAGSRLDDLLLEVLRKAVKTRGGNVQLVLGGGA